VGLTDAGAPPRRAGRRSWSGVLREPGPQRVLALATLVNTFGAGMFVTSSALYFTQIVGLPTDRYALGLLVAALVGILAGPTVGAVADRAGARRTLIAVMLAGAVAMSSYLLVATFWQFVAVAAPASAVLTAGAAGQAALIREFSGASAVEFRAYLRSATNLAMAVGALAAGAAIGIGSRDAYLVMIAGRAAAYVGCAAVLARLPRDSPAPRPARAARRWPALRDRPYLTATVLNALMSLHLAVPAVLIPLWIAQRTQAPRWMVSAVLAVNMTMVVLVQVRVSRGVGTVRAAGQRMLWAGVAIAVGLAVIAVSAGPPAPAAAGLLLAGIAVYTLGELWHAAASMEYSFGLAAPHAQGQYSGTFVLGTGLAQAAAPAVAGVLALSLGRLGLVLLGLFFVGVGALCRPLVSIAVRRAGPQARPT
jgi:hypothetical protein